MRVPGCGLLLIDWRFPGLSRDGARAPRECATSQKRNQIQTGLNWENLKKSRRNLRLIQTCDFFMLVNFDEKIVERTSARCEFFRLLLTFWFIRDIIISTDINGKRRPEPH